MTKVLIVDDEKFVRMGIAGGTDWDSLGCRLIGEAKDGEEGLAIARKTHPDLIVSDIRMPHMDGIEMIRTLREEHLDAKVVFLTAYSDFKYAQQAVRFGASDYLLKPFRDGELENVIRRVLGQDILHTGAVSEEEQDAQILPLQMKNTEMNRYVQAALDYIYDHYREDTISITEIASAILVSEGHLSRLFKKDTGLSINTYITHYRMRTAMRLLRNIRYKVYEVGELVGYHDMGYFSNTFKKLVGVTPSEFQEKGR